MTLNELLLKIKEVQPLAEEDTSGGPIETLRGRIGRKEQNTYILAQLKEAYEDELRRTAAFILVVGEGRNEFTKLATESFKCFSTNPETFFTELVDRIPSTLYLGKEGMQNIFRLLDSYIEEKMNALRVREYNQLIYTQEYQRHLNSKEDFLSLVKQAIVNKVGGEVVGLQAAHSLTNVAIQQNNSAKYTPILLPSGDERFVLKVSEDLARISNRVFIVAVGPTTDVLKNEELIRVEEVNATNVKRALKAVSDSVKKLQ